MPQTTGEAPPSMLIAAPVVKPARSEHRKHAIAANSSALPMRPMGTLAPILARNSSYGTSRRLSMPPHVLVGVDQPHQHAVHQDAVRCAFIGQDLHQRHPGRPRHRGRRAPACRGLRAQVEDVDDPAPFALLHARPDEPGQPMAANSFRSRSSCQISSVILSNVMARDMPALLIRMSTLPNAPDHARERSF